MSSPNATDTANYDEVEAFLNCLAQSSRDPDVEGYAVRLSLFIANVCLGILIKWSTEDVESSIYVVFMQIYTLLVVTFISLARQTLSIADTHFALTSTASPLAFYLVWSTTRWLFNYRSDLFLRLGKGRGTKIVSSLTCGMVMQWLILEIILYAAQDQVFMGERCRTPTLVGWIFYQITIMMLVVNYSFVLVFLWPLFCLIYTVRHIFDIAREFKRHQRKAKRWASFRFLQIPWMIVRNWTLSNWIVVTYAHRWMVYLMVIIVYVVWATRGLGVLIPDMGRFYNWVLKGLHEDNGGWPDYVPDPSFDPYSFGQLLAATVVLEPLWQVLKTIWESRSGLWSAIAHYPKSLWHGTVFLITGRRNPWKTILEERREQQRVDSSNLDDDELPLRGCSGEYKSDADVYSRRPGGGA